MAMVIKKVSWLKKSGVFALLFICGDLCAQTDSVAGKNYSFLNFDSVYAYYHSNDLRLDSVKFPDLFFEVFDWLKTPYAVGRTKNGIDCSDFASVLYENVFRLPFRGDCRAIYKLCETFGKDRLREGDFVFFSITSPLSHVGVYLGNNKFAHATVKAGVIVSDLDEAYYKKYFYCGGRLKLF